MQSTVTLSAAGLYTQPNQLNLPDGALTEATNVVIRRDNVIEPRRGFQLFGTSFGTSSDRLSQLFVYKGRIFRQYGDIIEFDTGALTNAGLELFSPLSGSFPPAQVGLRTKSVESNGNFYFTSSDGIQKLSALTTSDFTTAAGFVTLAGGTNALNMTATLAITLGLETGFLPQDSTVAYRTVWGYTDANSNLILGTPSQRAEVYNPLSTLLVGDFNNTLNAIQNTANQPAPNNSLINDTDYTSTLAVGLSTPSSQLRLNMISLAAKLDNDLLYANNTGTGVPLTISKVSIINGNSSTAGTANNVATITFSAGNPLNYFVNGSPIFLSGFPNAEGSTSINGAQVVTNVSSTTLSFLTSAGGNVESFSSANVDIVTPWAITIASTNTFKDGDPVQFTTTGTLPAPLASSTTYYLGNNTASTFEVYTDSALTSQVQFTTTGTGTHTATYFMAVTNTSINSNAFRSLTVPVLQNTPPTDDQLVSIQTYLQDIMTTLQAQLSTGTPPAISTYSQSTFITFLSLTTTANVNISFVIPPNLHANSFYQVYRSAITSAVGTDVLSDLVASDEMQLVFEAQPTPAQLAAGIVTLTDITPDAFRGANLYTNESSGVGLAGANATPPFALDINRFKNVVFYANTRTQYKEILNLLGVSQMLVDYNMGSTPSLVISDGITSDTYTFVAGIEQQTHIITVADIANSLNGTYWLINSADNKSLYYVWYKTSGGSSSDPMVAGRIGVEIFIPTGSTANQVATITASTLSTLLVNDFVTTSSTNNITITNQVEAYTNNASAGTSGFTVTTPIEGQGQRVSQQSDSVMTVADVAGSLNNKYFTFNTAFNRQQYYVWYNIGGLGVDPMVAGRIGVKVSAPTNSSASTIATNTINAIEALNKFVITSTAPSVFTLTSITFGPTAAPTVGTSGFTITNISIGALQVLLSNLVSPAQAVAATSNSLIQVINENRSGTINAFYLSGSGQVPGQMLFQSINLNDPQFFTVANNASTGSSFSPNISPSISIVSISLSGVVTTTTPHGLSTGQQVMLVGTNGKPNVDGLWTIAYISPTSFSIPIILTTADTGGMLQPAANAFAGANEVKPNRIYYSQFLEPEAVPLINFLDVGAADKPIYRIFPLRDSLFVFKQDGLYRISGEVAPWNVALFDSSVILTASDSVDVCNNEIYAWTTQGILSISESGISTPPISRAIDPQILNIGSNNYPNFPTATWGCGYESDHSYTVWTVSSPTDTMATIAYRYSTQTQTWTTYDKTDTCGIVNFADDRLYLGAGDTNFLEQERKTFTRLDNADRVLSSSLSSTISYIGNVMNLASVSGFAAGDVLVQNQTLTTYTYNSLLEKLDIDPSLYTSPISSISTGLFPVVVTSTPHNLSNGNIVFITGTNTTPFIDGIYPITYISSTSFSIKTTTPILTAGNAGVVRYSYYENLLIGNGADLVLAIENLAAHLNTEPGLLYVARSGSISGNTAAFPTVVTTTAPHGLGIDGLSRQVNITGVSGSVPAINGNQDIVILSPTTFSIDINVTVPGTGGSFSTIDDYISIVGSKSGSITNIALGDPTVLLTLPNHGLIDGRTILLSATNSSPSIDGTYVATVIDPNTVSIQAVVLIVGTSGSWETLDQSFADTLTVYNALISTLNKDSGTTFKNYMQSSDTTIQEAIITNVNVPAKSITINVSLAYVLGPLSIFKAIKSSHTYAPITFKDTLNLKHIAECTMMFDNKRFTTSTLNFSSDLIPSITPVVFNGDGNGIFGIGTGPFGGSFFGGTSTSAPFRTYIPRPNQRCRYLVVQHMHSIARESYSINGLSLTGTIQQSSRAYR